MDIDLSLSSYALLQELLETNCFDAGSWVYAMVAEQQAVNYTVQVATALLQVSVVAYSVFLTGVGRFLTDSNALEESKIVTIIEISAFCLCIVAGISVVTLMGQVIDILLISLVILGLVSVGLSTYPVYIVSIKESDKESNSGAWGSIVISIFVGAWVVIAYLFF